MHQAKANPEPHPKHRPASSPRWHAPAVVLALTVALWIPLALLVSKWLLMESARLATYVTGFAALCILLALASHILTARSTPKPDAAKQPTNRQRRHWIAIAALTGIAIGGQLATNWAASDIHRQISQRFPQSSALYANHDIARLVGHTLRAILEKTRDEIHTRAEQDKLSAIAAVVPDEWIRLADANDPRIVPLTENELWAFVQNPDADDAIDAERWHSLLDEWTAAARINPLSIETRNVATNQLTTTFAFAWREALKHDSHHDGMAAAAMNLDMLGELLRRTAHNANTNDKGVQTALADIAAALPALDTIITQVRLEQTAHHDRVLARFDRVNDALATIAASVQRIEDTTTRTLDEVREIREILSRKSAEDNPPHIALTDQERALIEAARTSSDAANRAGAAVVAGDFAAADAAIDQIERARRERKQARDEEDFHYWTLRGDRHYFAAQFDLAIEPYENAFELKPNDITARSNLAYALLHSKETDALAATRRAIEILEGTLDLLPERSFGWALLKHDIGFSYRMIDFEKGRRNLEAALEVFTPDNHPLHCATTHHNLCSAWMMRASFSTRPCTILTIATAHANAALAALPRDAPPMLSGKINLAIATLRFNYSTNNCSAMRFDDIPPAP